MNIGIIGMGARSEGLIKNFVEFDMGVAVTSIYDKDQEGAKNRLIGAGFDASKVNFFDDMHEMLEEGNLDGVIIGTNCNTHTDIAVEVMKYNIPMLLEKPVAINFEQIRKLEEASKNYKAEAVVSFPLRVSHLAQLAKEIIDSGKLGTIEHVQAINNVTYGRVYYKDWYRDASVTGGLFLQKATHDLDCINYLLNKQPINLCAMASKQIFTGEKEPGLVCSKCPEYKTCPESPYVLKHQHFGEESYGEGCSFAKDTENHDSASIIVKYDTGMHSVYTQNFFVRKDAGKRGARLMGYNGTLEFDWLTGELKVFSHTMPKVETHIIQNSHLNHYGGDKVLCENFIEVMAGTAKSKAPLNSGILSAKMCLYAEKSSKTNQFYDIK